MKRHHVIKLFAAAVVITLLSVVMLPKFQKAQHTAGVTKALHDLSEISKAIEIVNQQVTGEKRLTEVHQVYVRDNREDAKPEVLVTPLTGVQDSAMNSWQMSRIVGWGPYPNKELKALLTFDYRPPPGMLLVNNYIFKNEYLIETGVWRTFTREVGRNPHSPSRLDTIAFDREAKLPYVGIARGPYFDAHIGERKVATAETSFTFGRGSVMYHRARLVSDTHYVEYDPTNGIRSHGYVVYRSPAGPVVSVTEYYPDFRGLPIEKAVQSSP
ncbi:MAG: hypothetical protein P9L94_13005 [Candidatus Hinthialibacter antarcticus]|nr:hypothetical protein [Candidatus Hinthialibacter antarcticus]